MSMKSALADAEYAAENYLRHVIRSDAGDREFADAIANHILAATWFPRTYHLAVFYYGDGPGSLPSDWRAGSAVGISTPDRQRAKQWCVAALLAGYAISRGHQRFSRSKGFTGFYRGSLADYREIARERERD